MQQRGILMSLIAASLTAVSAFALYNSLYLGPAYSRLVVENAEKHAQRVATHLSERFFGKTDVINPQGVTPAFRTSVKEFLFEHGLERFKAFAPDGTVVFSTVPAEEGTRNTRPYFIEIVAQGRPYSIVVPRNSKTLEDRVVTADVVEAYVPVLRGRRFAGAFEIYYDITDPMNLAETLRVRSNLIVLSIGGGLLIVVALSSRHAILVMRERDQATRELQRERDRLEQAVGERTEALRKSHDNLEQVVAQRSAALETANQQLHAFSAHLHSAREEERKRVAREIHDELGQSLTAMKMELSVLRRGLPANLSQSFERAESLAILVEETTQAVKRISQDLRPGILDHLGLPAAIEWLAGEFERRTGTPCVVTITPQHIEIDEHRAVALFRIVQESLTNVVRHAAAGNVNIALGQCATGLLLQVQDDGRGFDCKNLHDPSFGFIGMRERMRPWDGVVEFSSAPGSGTVVTVFLPMKRESSS